MFKFGLIAGFVLLLGGAVVAQEDPKLNKQERTMIGMGAAIPRGPKDFVNDWKSGFCALAGIGFKTMPLAEFIAKLSSAPCI